MDANPHPPLLPRVAFNVDSFESIQRGIHAHIRNIAELCRHTRAGLGPENVVVMVRAQTARLFLRFLHDNISLSPQMRLFLDIDRALNALLARENNIPVELLLDAEWLAGVYMRGNWADPTVVAPAAAPPAAVAPAVAQPLDDFGPGGIMYGLQENVNARTGRRWYTIRRDLPRAEARVHGHNGITVGEWFPFHYSAVFRGAHGEGNQVVAGNAQEGAWSIVVSGITADDRDEGERLYYSTSRSHEHDDPTRLAPLTQGGTALLTSLRTRLPVRVLRNGNNEAVRRRNPFLPICGLRYDGLYIITSLQEARNARGGLYLSFRLDRLPGQTDFRQILDTSPTEQQVSDFYRVRQG
ncbi:hypothetical protein F5Y17DRAFT_454877 [Xylariaceae sp. FL0594]|nr:hypothetical protein F5Y17DRAFT_454877 [Xylariaceae sp. FL0594]